MASTFFCLYVHVVFGTHRRKAMIEATWGANLHGYLSGVVRGLEATPLIIGGVAAPVHLLIVIHAITRLLDLARNLRKAPTSFIREICLGGFC